MPEQYDAVEVYFPTQVYVVDKPEFLDIVNLVSEENLKNSESNEYFCMSNNYFDDKRLEEFSNYSAQTAWNFLNSQGYFMDDLTIHASEMWTQKHNKHSYMPQHVHSSGIQVVGFYFLNSCENCSRLLIHDPRPAKNQINLSEKNSLIVSPASSVINFEPKPGRFIFLNSWVPHSFSKNTNDEPTKFVHINFYVNKQQSCKTTNVEIV